MESLFDNVEWLKINSFKYMLNLKHFSIRKIFFQLKTFLRQRYENILTSHSSWLDMLIAVNNNIIEVNFDDFNL